MSGSSPRAALSLEASARRIGHYCWIEMRTFEILGAWSASVPDPAIRAVLATHSRQHGWHAELWHELLPAIGETDQDGGRPAPCAESGKVASLVAPPAAALVAFLETLAGAQAPELTIEKLVGAYRVLMPHAISTYARHLQCTSPISDGPTIRALRLVLSDQRDHWHEGEALLQARLRSDADVHRASSHQLRLETLLVRAGGIAGTSPHQ